MMQRLLPITPLLFPLLLAGCLFTPGEQCPVHCWQHNAEWATTPLTSDLTPSAQDLTCNDEASGDELVITDIPELASIQFNGVTCPQAQADHDTIKRIIDAIESGTIAMESGNDIQTYQDFVGDLALALRDDCIAGLTVPDIDTAEGSEGSPGLQSCSYDSALAVCNAYIYYPTIAQLGDLSAGASFTPPVAAAGDFKIIQQGAACDFVPDLADPATGGNDDGTGGGGTGGGGTGDSGLDETGLDETGTSTGESGFGPFGDIDTLVTCDYAGVSCTYQGELLDNIHANFSVFYEDRVTLTLLPPTDPEYPGVRLGGLDVGEASTDLATAFDLQNGDVIENVNGIDIDDQARALEAINAMVSSRSVALSLKRGDDPVQYRFVSRQ